MPTPVPWRSLLAAALDESSVVAVGALVKTYLGREPTRSEINSARRAALRYAAAGHAQVGRLPAQGNSPAHGRLLLVWPGTTTDDVARLRMAVEHVRLPGRVRRPEPVNAASARTIAATVTDAGRAVEHVEVDRLDAVTAMAVADELDEAVRVLRGFRRALRIRAERLSQEAGLSNEQTELLADKTSAPRRRRRRKPRGVGKPVP